MKTFPERSAGEWQPTVTATADGRDDVVFAFEQTDPESALVDCDAPSTPGSQVSRASGRYSWDPPVNDP